MSDLKFIQQNTALDALSSNSSHRNLLQEIIQRRGLEIVALNFDLRRNVRPGAAGDEVASVQAIFDTANSLGVVQYYFVSQELSSIQHTFSFTPDRPFCSALLLHFLADALHVDWDSLSKTK